MVTYEQIEKANSEIITTDIKGKMYADVNQRIKAFRKCYPMGTIATEMISNQNGVCIFRASVYAFGDPAVNSLLGTGTAYEKENSSFINKTSYIENCETSAVGRALGMAGFGIDNSVASADEVANAIAIQETMTANAKKNADTKITADQVGTIKSELLRTGVTEDAILKRYKVGKLEELSSDQAKNCIGSLAKSKPATEGK